MHPLVVHPATPAGSIDAVEASLVSYTSADFIVEFSVRSAASLLLPPPSSPKRTDGLWKTTCFELFLKPEGGEAYYEYNCSPSLAWAAYEFAGYREGMRELPLTFEPQIGVTPGDQYFLYAELDVSRLGSRPAKLGLSAVIEEVDGTQSYWALAHPLGKPDFHHPDCFALTLPAPDAE